MEDYKKEQWEIDLDNTLNQFTDDYLKHITDSKLKQIEGSKIGGKIAGLKNKQSGHMSKLGKKNGKKNGNHPNSIAAAKINGQKNVERKFWEKVTFEQRSRGGKIAGKKRTQMPDFYDLQCKAGKNSGKKRVEKSLNIKKQILDLVENDRFITSELRRACDKFGYKSWKSVLKEKKIIKQIYKGKNQFDPSIYEKIK